MSWKRYQNELMILGAFLLMLSMYLYKQYAHSSNLGESSNAAMTIVEIKEIAGLKKIWADKQIGKKVEKLRTMVPSSKIKWNKRSKKLTALYQGLKPSELNKLMTKIFNTAVIIEKLNIQKTGSNYSMEFQCRW